MAGSRWRAIGVRLAVGFSLALIVALGVGLAPLGGYYSASSLALQDGSLSQTQWLVSYLRAPSEQERNRLRGGGPLAAHFKSVPRVGSLEASSVGARWMYAIAHVMTREGKARLMRWLSVVMLALTAWMLFDLASSSLGLAAGVVAALFFLVLPGALFHGRSISVESAVLFATMAAFYSYLRGLESRLWALLAGPAFGLALCTAIETIFLIVPFTAISLMRRRAESSAQTPPASGDRGRLELAPTLLTPIWLLVAGVGVYLLAHPALWGAAKGPVIDALVAEFKKPHPLALFFGSVSPRGATPSFATTVELLLTRLPLVVLLPVSVGAVLALRRDALAEEARALVVTTLLVTTTLLVAHGLLGSPFYAGTNHLVLYWPFVALVAAVGATELARRVTALIPVEGRWPRVVRGTLVAVLLVPSAVLTLRALPQEPAFSNVLVSRGGQFWGAQTELLGEAVVSRRLVDWINRSLPRSARYAVRSEQGHDGLVSQLVKRGILRTDLRYAAELEFADYVLVFPSPGRARTADWIGGYANLTLVHRCRIGVSTVCAVFRLAGRR